MHPTTTSSFLLNFCSEFDGKPPFNPTQLNPVMFYDFTDWTTLYADIPHTMPIQPIPNQAIINAQDKATLTKYLTQSTTINAPVTQLDPNGKQCAYFSGVSKSIATAPGNTPAFGTSQQATFFFAYWQVSRPGSGSVYMFDYGSTGPTVPGSVYLIDLFNGTEYHGVVGGQTCEGNTPDLLGAPRIVTQLLDMTPNNTAAQALQVRYNGVVQSLTYDINQPPNGVGQNANFGSNTLAMSNQANGMVGYQYCIIAYPTLLSAADCKKVEDWINARVGAY